MKPICLVIPPSIFLLDERVFMTLGILKIAAVLEQTGRSVEMLDLSGIENYVEAVRDHASRSEAQIFGITATTPQMPAAAKIVEAIRDVRPDARTILGGPHVTLVCASRKREMSLGVDGRATRAYEGLAELVDVIVAGDGEDAVHIAIGDSPPELIDADDPQSPLFMSNADYEASPWPARHLVDVASYHYHVDGHRALSMITQLGCPFSCSFCGGRKSPMLRRVRKRSTGSVVSEMRHLYNTYGFCGFMFYDDELNVNPRITQLMNEIADLQESLGVEFRLRGFIKAELLTDEQAEAMRRAGFRWILTGFESGAPRILQNINKHASVEDNTRCVDIARRHEVKIKALMSIGHPGETEETIQMTQDWLLAAAPDDFDVAIITCYPGTPYYDDAVPHPEKPGIYIYTSEKTGDRLYSHDLDYMVVADYYKGDPDGGYKAFVCTDSLSENDLVRLRDAVERDVRDALGIAFNPGVAAKSYEHSTGQVSLPSNILRCSWPPGDKRSAPRPPRGGEL